MNNISETFRERFEAAFGASPYNSKTQLSKDSECSPSRAGKIIAGDFDHSKDGPGIFGVWRMSEKMGSSLNELLPPTTVRVERPGLPAFFARYRHGESHLSDFADILEFCDVYRQPKRGRCFIEAVGPKSLLAEKTQVTDASIQQAEFDAWSPDRKDRIFQWQLRAWRAGVLAEPEHFNASYRAAGRRFQLSLLRAACRVLTHDLKPRLLIYCEPIWQEQRNSGH